MSQAAELYGGSFQILSFLVMFKQKLQRLNVQWMVDNVYVGYVSFLFALLLSLMLL